MQAIRPTGVENLLGEEELIVSKTDLKGRITELPPNEWTPVVGSLSLEVLNGTCTSVVY